MSKPAPSPPPLQNIHVSRRLACRLAAAADTDFRSAMKAMREGAAAVRGRAGVTCPET